MSRQSCMTETGHPRGIWLMVAVAPIVRRMQDAFRGIWRANTTLPDDIKIALLVFSAFRDGWPNGARTRGLRPSRPCHQSNPLSSSARRDVWRQRCAPMSRLRAAGPEQGAIVNSRLYPLPDSALSHPILGEKRRLAALGRNWHRVRRRAESSCNRANGVFQIEALVPLLAATMFGALRGC